MGQIFEWPKVITEGEILEECPEMLEDNLKEVILANCTIYLMKS